VFKNNLAYSSGLLEEKKKNSQNLPVFYLTRLTVFHVFLRLSDCG
jgi:hypothetical protein